jgi:FecR protein
MKKVMISCIFMLFFISAASAEILVVSKQGEAAYKAGNQWVPLGAGVMLPVGSKVSTGVRSSVVLNMNGHTVTIYQLSMVNIMQNSIEKNKSTTRIGLKRGSIRAKVSRQERIKTVFQVATPVATSSVRGTEEIISYGPGLGMHVTRVSGSIVGESRNGGSQHLNGWLAYRHKPGVPQGEPFFEDLKESVFYNVYFKNVTPEEQEARDYFIGDGHEEHNNGYMQPGGVSSTGSIANTRIILLWR